ncbi:WD40 repeat domain-containing protein [Streptomyces sp. V1I1]|uniref:WD40 repeat domain-containing protein n=1 Tax=Streptomyces sp. V1I1 TaxID=3042272 RepID=UPI00278287E2|nr:hypothetical protein [Streptomyces sp. V1I1]MDQ0938835.1 WD40 repeat protein [Streptomyces sp. V1I1]
MNEDPDRVRELLEGSRLPVAVYEASGDVHRRATAGVRRQLLALDAARYGQRQLAEDIGEVTVEQDDDTPWVVRWGTGTELDSRQLYALPVPAAVCVVATAVVEGRGLAVAGCEDGTLHWWDLATGRRLGKAVTGHPGAVRALATAVLDGRPVAVTGSSDAVVRLWDLAVGEQVGVFPAGADAWVRSLATGLVEGQPVAVSLSGDGVVRVWDLAARTQRGGPWTSQTGAVSAVATAVLDGRPVVVTGSPDGTVRVWDLIAGRETGFVLRHATRAVCLLVTGPAYDPPMAVSSDGWDVRIWNLATGEQIGEPLYVRFMDSGATAMLDGRPAAVVAYSVSGKVDVWDLSAHRHLRPPHLPHLRLPLLGHRDTVRGVATAVVKGRHLTVSGGDDRSVRIWDLDGEREAGSPLSGHAGPVRGVTTAVVDGRPVILTGGWDKTVRIWDLDGGGQLGEPLTGHTSDVHLLTVGMVDGRPTLITRDRHEAVRIWDLTTREQLHGRSTTEYTSPNIEFFAALDGRFVAVTGQRVWDLTARQWIGVEPQEGYALALETLEGRNVILTGRAAETVHLWDMATGERLGPPMTGHTSRVRAGAAGMLDGRLVVAAGGDDGTVRVWDVTTGRQTGAYTFPARIWGLAVAPGGRLVVGFGSDITVLAHR